MMLTRSPRNAPPRTRTKTSTAEANNASNSAKTNNSRHSPLLLSPLAVTLGQ
ncbi:hypothetical protein D3C83_245300 [compost metagenome]